MSDEPVFAVINPLSGKGNIEKKWESDVLPLLKKHYAKIDFSFTRHSGHAVELVRRNLHQNASLILVLGGDGTLNESVNGFFEKGALINPNASLGILPFGSGGDFLRTLKIPRDWKKALNALSHYYPRPLDVGRVDFSDSQFESRYFLNIANVGVVASVMASVNAMPRSYPSWFKYLWGSFKGFRSYKNMNVNLSFDQNQFEQTDLTSLTVANGKFFGNGMCPAPDASPEDGFFDVAVLKKTQTFQFFTQILPYLYSGKSFSSGSLGETRRCREIRVESIDKNKKISIEMDGENYGEGDVTFTLIPKILKVLTPK